MNLYQQAVWNELKLTLEEYVRLVELSQNPTTTERVSRQTLDRLRYKINGLESQLDEKARVA